MKYQRTYSGRLTGEDWYLFQTECFSKYRKRYPDKTVSYLWYIETYAKQLEELYEQKWELYKSLNNLTY